MSKLHLSLSDKLENELGEVPKLKMDAEFYKSDERLGLNVESGKELIEELCN